MYVLAKNSSLVAIDVITRKELWIHANLRGITNRGINYWQSTDGKDRRLLFALEDTLQAIDARTGKSIADVRQERRGRSQGRARTAIPLTIRRVMPRRRRGASSRTCCCSAARRAKAISPRPGTSAPTTWSRASSPGPSTPSRSPANSATTPGRRTRGNTSAASTCGARSRSMRSAASPTSRCRRPPTTTTAPIGIGSESVQRLPAGARCAHRQTPVAFPDGASRPVGLRPDGRAAADHACARTARRIDAVAQATKQGFVFVFDRVTGRARVADRRTPGAEERRAGRSSVAHAAVFRRCRQARGRW